MSDEKTTACNNKSSVFNSGLKTPSIEDESIVDEINIDEQQARAETIIQKVCEFKEKR